MRLSELPTPAAVLDLGKLKANCARMLERTRALGVKLRPHLKTLKSADAARVAVDPSHGGIAASTLKEAEYFADHGFDDIQCALCMPADKLGRIADLTRRAPRFSFFLDSVEMATATAAFARARGVTLRAWIELDCGEHRTGVAPDDPALIEIARVLAGSAVVFEGLATHAGHSYVAAAPDAVRAIAEDERRALIDAAARLAEAGFAPPALSAGSTPTAIHSACADGLSELRAGVYMAGDLFQAAIGSLHRDDIALTVLATVISHNRARNQIVVDAGGLALSKDRSTQRRPEADAGYGLVLDVAGRPAFGELHVAGVHQEHGEIRSKRPLPFDALPIGARVRIAPNHVCMTAAAYDSYAVVDGGEAVIATWPRANGW
jgi:D-serine deaminase-like pyridoxal phosphate-dependent protein